jgi:hypothetical protein
MQPIVLTAADARLAAREDVVRRKPADFGVRLEEIERAWATAAGSGASGALCYRSGS